MVDLLWVRVVNWLAPPSTLGDRLGEGELRRLNLLALDQAVDMPTEVRELRELLGRDLVAREGKIDVDDLLHHRRRVRQDDDTIREVDRLVDVVRHEQDRDRELLTDLQNEILQVTARLRVDRRKGLVHQ